MSDIINLLPDAVANQIAAGEVVQRPASALKEMVENAIDAGADEIQVILKDAGKALIRVVDNGAGMSEADARMCFERHATSKIAEAKDLFALRSFGFRGEALASIAAVAQVEMKTRRKEQELGTGVIVEGSKITGHEPVSCPEGTSIAVKNLFFNVPARRNFLKSNNVELRHCIEEFQRIAIANPDTILELFHNDRPVLQLKKGNLKQRIVAIFGNNFDEKIVPVEAETSRIKISGYIGKPEYAKKTKGEQYFFVNGRFIKHHYLNHAVQNAFEELIPDGSFPTYFIFFEVDPADIDVNIHPTKTEINFLDAKLIYSFLRSAVKQAFGKFSIAPTIDFNSEQTIDIPPPPRSAIIPPPTVKIDPSYSPFQENRDEGTRTKANWEKMFSPDSFPGVQQEMDINAEAFDDDAVTEHPDVARRSGTTEHLFLQVQSRFILTGIKSGLMLIDQRKAHQRVLYENFMENLENATPGSQKTLFPETWHLNASDASLVKELNEQFLRLGFEISSAGTNSFIVNGVPADLPQELIIQTLENTLEKYKNQSTGSASRHKRLAKAMAKSMSIGNNKYLSQEEMQTLANSLFACSAPENDLDGGKTLIIWPFNKLAEMF